MHFKKLTFMIRTLLVVFSLGLVTTGTDAFARAGGKRSFGQRSHPTTMPRSPNPPPQQQPPPQTPPASSGRGSFMKGLAGGLAGGLLGSMLFSSMGHAAGFGGMGGGIGFLDILLIGGLIFIGYRLWKNRPRYAAASPQMASSYGNSSAGLGSFGPSYGAPMMAASRLDRETAEDLFFRVQSAWTRRDLSAIRSDVEPDVMRVLEADLQDLKARRAINRLENIAVRNLEISEPWWDGDREFVRVRFTASLLDYTVDESTDTILEGSNREPVKFDEFWTFAKSQGRSSWQLAGIEQI